MDAVAWIDPLTSQSLPTTPELAEILKSAQRIESGLA